MSEQSQSWKKLTATMAGVAALGGTVLVDMPQHLIWPITAIVCAGLVAQGLSDFAKYWRQK